jgi:uncharacterized protein (TIGR00255 family)
MTGYGRATVEDGGRVTAEVRAVNGRFLKLSVKVLGRYAALEERVRELLGKLGIKRANIDVSLFFDDASGGESNYGISEAAVKHFVTQARALAKKHKLKGDVPLSALLPLPGVVVRESPDEDIEKVWDRARRALEAALADFDHMRARDGAACVADIRARLAELAQHRDAISIAAPEAVKGAIRKYGERIAKLLAEASVSAPLNPDVLERETVLMSDRLDIVEELSRLQSHFEQMEAALVSGGEAGKKLDFLTQELFRETNTIGSKAQDQSIVHHVVEMKGQIEKIREQAQNLE